LIQINDSGAAGAPARAIPMPRGRNMSYRPKYLAQVNIYVRDRRALA